MIDELESHAELFTEFPGRFVMTTNDVAAFTARAALAGVPVTRLGPVGGANLRIGSVVDLAVAGRRRPPRRRARSVARRGRLARRLQFVEHLVGHAQIAGPSESQLDVGLVVP